MWLECLRSTTASGGTPAGCPRAHLSPLLHRGQHLYVLCGYLVGTARLPPGLAHLPPLQASPGTGRLHDLLPVEPAAAVAPGAGRGPLLSPLPPPRGPALLGSVAGVSLLGLAAGHGLHARSPLLSGCTGRPWPPSCISPGSMWQRATREAVPPSTWCSCCTTAFSWWWPGRLRVPGCPAGTCCRACCPQPGSASFWGWLCGWPTTAGCTLAAAGSPTRWTGPGVSAPLRSVSSRRTDAWPSWLRTFSPRRGMKLFCHGRER